MNKFFAIVLFPFIWIFMYLSRIIWYDFLHTVIQIIVNLFIFPLSSLRLLVTLPFVLVLDIPIGLFVTFFGSICMSYQLFTGELDLAGAIKSCFCREA